VLDDVVMDAQRQAGLYGLNDISQVEVLRGPQGTLFGKNSTSGVIAITTKNPVLKELSGDGSLSYGERNDRNVYGSLNIPLGDISALRVSAFRTGTGWIRELHRVGQETRHLQGSGGSSQVIDRAFQ